MIRRNIPFFLVALSVAAIFYLIWEVSLQEPRLMPPSVAEQRVGEKQFRPQSDEQLDLPAN